MKIEYFNSDRRREMIKFVAEMLKVEPLAVEQAIDSFEDEYPESLGFTIADIFDQNERDPNPYPLSRANPAHIEIAKAAVIAVGSDFELHDSDWYRVDEAIKDACKEAGLVRAEEDDEDDIDEDDDDLDDDDLIEDEDEDDDDWDSDDDCDEDEVSSFGPTQHSRPSTDQPALPGIASDDKPDLRYFEGDNKNDYE